MDQQKVYPPSKCVTAAHEAARAYYAPSTIVYAVGDWLHCPTTGHTARVVRVDTPVAACGPVHMYLCETAKGETVYFGHIEPIVKVEEPMTNTANTTPGIQKVAVRTVNVPVQVEHQGIYSMYVRLEWKCPVCGGTRGEPHATLSYDGSRRMTVDGWENACGHVDGYAAVRKEASENGLNPDFTPAQPDPWNAPEAPTSAVAADVVAAAHAEVADIQQEADAAVTAAADEAREANTMLADAVATINADSDALAAAHQKRARALKRAKTYRAHLATANKRIEGVLRSAVTHKATIRTLRAQLESTQLAAAASERAVVNASVEIDTLRMKIAAQRAQLDATPSAPYAASDNLDAPARHIGDSTAEAELVAAQNTIALQQERIDELVRKLNTNVQPTPGTRRLSTAAVAVVDDDTSDKVETADALAAIMKVLRTYGYEAYANGKRIAPEVWAAQQLANIGTPIEGGAGKSAAS